MTVDTLAYAWASSIERYAPRALADIEGVVVHRIQVSLEHPGYSDTPAEVMRFFATHPAAVSACGGKMPYPLLVQPDGRVVQTVPLLRVTPHARAHNPRTIAVACIGDFRASPPTAEQKRALVALCSALLFACGLDATSLYGHDELPGGSADPGKACPGSMLGMAYLRDVVSAALRQQRHAELALVW